ncbi:MAG TPA: metal-dependent transcriptional regulator [Anaerolineales bacterium]|nr:metal-dependent transcriptional regulator [Anaerolineales bacterium]
MPARLTPRAKDALQIIYTLTENGGRASPNAIAARLEISSAGFTYLLQKLAAEPALVDYQKRRGVKLTSAGNQAALRLIRRHRLLELFLVQTLGVAWHSAHTEAGRLEHVISAAFEERIAQMLGDLQVAPYGHPIPNRDLQMPQQPCLPLCNLRPRQTARVVQMQDDDSALLNYLEQAGLTPQAVFTVLDYSPFDGNLALQVSGHTRTWVLGPSISRQISVSPISAG